jgi:signal transduction histidine kinase
MEEKRHEAIAKIAAGVSHNFNNMLGVCFGNIMLVESMLQGKIDATTGGALEDVRKSLERMQKLVQKFLLLTHNRKKNQQLFFLRVPVHNLIEEVAGNIRDQKSEAIEMAKVNIVNHTDPAAVIFCDDGHAREIFQLLLSEIIEITAGRAKLRVESALEDGHLAISITVENYSFPDQVINSIFEPFGMPLANVGTGLAFAAAKQLLSVNDGSILAERNQQNNIVFKLTFQTK